jgi:hypothetical protein
MRLPGSASRPAACLEPQAWRPAPDAKARPDPKTAAARQKVAAPLKINPSSDDCGRLLAFDEDATLEAGSGTHGRHQVGCVDGAPARHLPYL